MKTSKHTPTPWTLWEENEHFVLSGKTTIAEVYSDWGYAPKTKNERIAPNEEGKANAEFIVRAVNSHEELLKAAKEAEDALAQSISKDGKTDWRYTKLWALRNAIAKAEGK